MKRALKTILFIFLSISFLIFLVYFNVNFGGYYENPEDAAKSLPQKAKSIIDTIIYDDEAVVFYQVDDENTQKSKDQTIVVCVLLTSKNIFGKIGWGVVGIRDMTGDPGFFHSTGLFFSNFSTYNLKSARFKHLDKFHFGFNKSDVDFHYDDDMTLKHINANGESYTLWYKMNK